jgi:hypothetical protein
LNLVLTGVFNIFGAFHFHCFTDFRCEKLHLSEEELYQQELREAMEVKGTKDIEDAS